MNFVVLKMGFKDEMSQYFSKARDAFDLMHKYVTNDPTLLDNPIVEN